MPRAVVRSTRSRCRAPPRRRSRSCTSRPSTPACATCCAPSSPPCAPRRRGGGRQRPRPRRGEPRGATASATCPDGLDPGDGPARRPAGRRRAVAHPAAGAARRPAHPQPQARVYGRVVGRLAAGCRSSSTPTTASTPPRATPAPRTAVLALEAAAARFSHAELIQNLEDLDLLCGAGSTAGAATRLLGNGVDLDRFRPGAGPDERAAPAGRAGRRSRRRGRGHGRPPRGREGRSSSCSPPPGASTTATSWW